MGSVATRRVKQLHEDLARCNREIAAIDAGQTADAGAAAFLVTLGREDWQREKTLIENELRQYGD